MDSSKLLGTFRGSTALTLYRPIGNNIYNVDNRISALYNTTTTQPTTANNYLYYTAGSPNWLFRPYQVNGGTAIRSPSIYWRDMTASNSVFDLTNQHYLTYNGDNNKFVAYQKLFIVNRSLPGAPLSDSKLSSGRILVLNDTTISNDNAFLSPTGINQFISAFTPNLLLSYLTCNSAGVLLQNACYNRNMLINANIYFSLTSIGNGATFTFYIYLADVIIAESTMSCKTGQKSLTLFVNTVLKTTVADVGKRIYYKIKYTAGDATPLNTIAPTQFYASVRTL
jgi:hypothetical protein